MASLHIQVWDFFWPNLRQGSLPHVLCAAPPCVPWSLPSSSEMRCWQLWSLADRSASFGRLPASDVDSFGAGISMDFSGADDNWWQLYQTKGKGALLTRGWEIGWDWTTSTAMFWFFYARSMGSKPPTAGIDAGHPKVSLSPIGRYLLFLALCIWHTPATSTSSTHWISSSKDTGTIINPPLEVGLYCKPH